jgi:hypothetical protein
VSLTSGSDRVPSAVDETNVNGTAVLPPSHLGSAALIAVAAWIPLCRWPRPGFVVVLFDCLKSGPRFALTEQSPRHPVARSNQQAGRPSP